MAPTVGMKRMATQTITLPPPNVRFTVHEAVRSTITSPPVDAPARVTGLVPAVEGFLCLEEVDGRWWSYVVDEDAAKGRGRGRRGARPLSPWGSPLGPCRSSHRCRLPR